MKKEYVYRKHISILKKFSFIVLTIISLILFLIGLLILIFQPNKLWIFIFLTIVSSFLFGEGILLNYFYGRFTKVKVILDDEGMIYINHKGETKISYSEIIKLDTPSVRYMGGWLKIKTPDDTIRLTVVIENIQDLIYELKRQLDLIEKSNTYDENKLFNFMKTATYSDMSWNRIYRILRVLLWTIVVDFLLLVAVASIFSIINYLHLLFMLEILIITILYLVTEIYFGRVISKQITQFEVIYNDIAFENKFYMYFYFVGLIILLVIELFIISLII